MRWGEGGRNVGVKEVQGCGGGVCPLCATGWCCMPSCPWCPMVLLAAWPWPTRVSPCLTQHNTPATATAPPPPCPVLPPCSLVVDVCDHVTDEAAPSHADDHQGHAWSAAAAAEGVSTAADTPTSTWVLDVPPPQKTTLVPTPTPPLPTWDSRPPRHAVLCCCVRLSQQASG